MYGSLLAITFYCVNLILTFSLTIILYLCIVRLKELKNLKKLEPVAIIASCFSFLFVVFLSFASYDECKQKPKVKFSSEGDNELVYIYIAGYSIAGLLHFIISILVVIIFIKAVKRSRSPLQGKDEKQAESPLLTSNKWKTLSKQLLPLVVYPIVNTVVAMIVFPLAIVSYKKIKHNSPLSVLVYTLLASLGLITSTVVILHLCILKSKKRRRRKEDETQDTCLKRKNDIDTFTEETIASTNARTTYHFTSSSSLTMN